MGDPLGGDDVQNTRIALSAILLSSVFIFNNSSHPDRSSLQFLRYLDTIRKRMQNQQEQQQLHYPSFLWVFRDFFLQLPYKRSAAGKGAGQVQQQQQQYTLKEYMLERVFNQSSSAAKHALSPQYGNIRKNGEGHFRGNGGGGVDNFEGNVVDSLLHDFSDFNVLKIGYPKRNGQIPFEPDELTNLGNISFEEFDDDFRKDVNAVVKYCLDASKPFALGTNISGIGNTGDSGGNLTATAADNSKNKKNGKQWSWLSPFTDIGKGRQKQKSNYASPEEYARWCESVIEIVNSEGIIPNIPDMQHQLLQKMADEQVNKAALEYTNQITLYLDSCSVYNNVEEPSTANNTKLIQEYHLKGVAEQEELIQTSDDIMTILIEKLRGSISSASILTKSLMALKMQCHDIVDATTTANQEGVDKNIPPSSSSSVLSELLVENKERSKVSCEVLAHSMYDPIREIVRDVDPSSPTFMTVKEFDKALSQIKDLFQRQARGPCINEMMTVLLDEPSFADRLLLEKNQMLHASINVQKQLSKDVQNKESELKDLQKDLEVAVKKQQQQIELLQHQHKQAMEIAFKEQSQKLLALQEDMESKLASSEKLLKKEQRKHAEQLQKQRKDSESRLAEEIEAREKQIMQEKKVFQDELNKVSKSAKLHENTSIQMEKELKVAEQQRIQQEQKLELEMKQKIKEANDKLELEQKHREEEVTQVQNDIKQKEQEHRDLLHRLEEAEQSCPKGICCWL